jgi:glucose/arabinose dehydrogenase
MKLTTLFSAVGLSACSSSDPAGPDIVSPEFNLAVQEVVAGLSNPLYVTAPPGDSRLFVVEQLGRIRIIKNGQLLPTPFLDISTRVSSGGERGLLSVAFHPSYATNGFFFVNFTDLSGDTRVERFSVSTNADLAVFASRKLILAVAQPFANHNGGLNLFGPDGMLYVGLGDGGSGGDPSDNGQNRGALLGKILRIDVDRGDPYAVPPDNPFVGQQGARGEVWAYGLRNPWRFAFDRQGGLLYVADVGQDRFEEIDVVPANRAGVNYGWNRMEGSACFNSSSCNQQGSSCRCWSTITRAAHARFPVDSPTGAQVCRRSPDTIFIPTIAPAF